MDRLDTNQQYHIVYLGSNELAKVSPPLPSNIMLVLLLIYYLNQGTLSEAISSNLFIEKRDLSQTWNQDNGRTLWNIIWSCLSTIFLCTWVAIHPNITFRPTRRRLSWSERWLRDPLQNLVEYKLPLFLCALLVPEYILAWAIRQHLRAGEIQKLGKSCHTQTRHSLRGVVPGWTRTHAFFMIMGGFHLFRLPADAPSSALLLKTSFPSKFVVPLGHHSREDEVAVCPLQIRDLPVDVLEIIAPEEAELKDRGKSDGLTKLIVLIQTLWFVIQCIARSIQHLPLTELEIVTLAYAMLNFFIYVFWWDKPRNVECPIRVYKTSTASHEKDMDLEYIHSIGILGLWTWTLAYIMGEQDSYTDLSEESAVPMFWSGRPHEGFLSRASLGPLILGAAFGAIHCIAWNYEFPSQVELLLWRISCMAMIIVPIIAAIYCIAFILAGKSDGTEYRIDVFYYFLIVVLVLTGWLYIASRIGTLVIAFATLRSIPPASLSVVEWTTFIPHI